MAQALRAARLGSVTLFALDDNAFLEPGAAWIRGERTARFIVQPDGGAAVMRLQGGAVANTITLAASGWRMEVALAANDIRDLPLPADALAPAVLSVTSATGFRPSEHTPAATTCAGSASTCGGPRCGGSCGRTRSAARRL